MKVCKELADNGDRYAQFSMGVMYHKGDYVIPNHKKAYDYFIKAAYNGQIDAMGVLGLYYYEGIGVRRDEFESYVWSTLYLTAISIFDIKAKHQKQNQQIAKNAIKIADKRLSHADIALRQEEAEKRYEMMGEDGFTCQCE